MIPARRVIAPPKLVNQACAGDRGALTCGALPSSQASQNPRPCSLSYLMVHRDGSRRGLPIDDFGARCRHQCTEG